MLKKLPIGISTLRDILEDDYLYVDKTDLAQALIEDGRYYFLSRPRRFGKSLILDTFRTIFEGEKELLSHLHIAKSGYSFEKHPVIRISFNDGDFSSKEAFHRTLLEILDFNQEYLELECPQESSPSFCFKKLIRRAYKKYNKKVVILIDEYDKPILDNIENSDVARLMREELKNFYSVIKGADEFLKFVFITGVSKFSKVSLFSGLNNIEDITLDRRYATICGYRQIDLETTFKAHLQGQDFTKIKEWYNGYKFLGEGVYNPFDILLFIAKGFEYRNYWFSTATPTFLLKLIEKNNYFLPNLENIVKDEAMLNSFDVDYIELETLMWQTGYLTITSSYESLRGIRYRLGIPNKEVTLSIMSSFVHFLSKNSYSDLDEERLSEALINADMELFKNALTALFAGIAYNNFTGAKLYEYEGYYVSVFYGYLKALGITLIAEDVTNRGRIDLTLKLPNAIYIIEFKVESEGKALEQIKEKKYYEKYLSESREIYLMGIEFSKESRNIASLEFEKL